MKNLVLFFSIIITLGACSSSVKSFYVIDENKINAKCFSFYAKKSSRTNPFQLELDSIVENIVKESLSSKGFRIEYPSELYISYYFKSGNSKTPNTRPTYYGPYNNPTSDVNNVHSEKGIFLIEFWDSNDKLIWQGSKTFNSRKSQDARRLVQKYATEAISSFKSNL